MLIIYLCLFISIPKSGKDRSLFSSYKNDLSFLSALDKDFLDKLLLNHKPLLFSNIENIHEKHLIVSVLNGTFDRNVEEIRKKITLPYIMADGSIVNTDKYDVLDIGWAICIIKAIKYTNNKAKFGTNPTWIQIPNKVTIAMIGNFGGGTWENNNVFEKIKKNIEKMSIDISLTSEIHIISEQTEKILSY